MNPCSWAKTQSFAGTPYSLHRLKVYTSRARPACEVWPGQPWVIPCYGHKGWGAGHEHGERGGEMSGAA
jgi:hypothetical protein